MIAQDDKKLPTKIESTLILLINKPFGVNTFEANSVYGDTCLHTTISEIKKYFGIVAKRQWELLNNKYKTRCKRYWLADEDIDKVKQIVNLLRVKRGAKPLYDTKEGEHDQ